jgi:hypothetical protein
MDVKKEKEVKEEKKEMKTEVIEMGRREKHKERR